MIGRQDGSNFVPITSLSAQQSDASHECKQDLVFRLIDTYEEMITLHTEWEQERAIVQPRPSQPTTQCVYVLVFWHDDLPYFYIGQTKNLQKRIRQHTARPPLRVSQFLTRTSQEAEAMQVLVLQCTNTTTALDDAERRWTDRCLSFKQHLLNSRLFHGKKPTKLFWAIQ